MAAAPRPCLSFSGSNGCLPWAGLTLNGSTLYGTTEYGGPNYNGSPYSGNGTVFSIATSGGSPTTLLLFSGSNGANPFAGLTLNGSTLYGTTYSGGANNTARSSASQPAAAARPPCSRSAAPAVPLSRRSMCRFDAQWLNPLRDDLLGWRQQRRHGFQHRNQRRQSYHSALVQRQQWGASLGRSHAQRLNPLWDNCFGGAYDQGTVFALNVAPATIALGNVANASIIRGGTASVRDGQ